MLIKIIIIDNYMTYSALHNDQVDSSSVLSETSQHPEHIWS